MLKTRTTKVLTALVVVAVAVGAYRYHQWWEQVEYLRWLGRRNVDLKAIGDRILEFGNTHDGVIPTSVNSLVELGVVAAADIASEDSERRLKVTRQFRLVPSTRLSGDLILIVEQYDPQPGDRLQVYHLDGRCYVEMARGIPNLIAKDNALRSSHGLPELDVAGIATGR